jgi:hypothetical protein
MRKSFMAIHGSDNGNQPGSDADKMKSAFDKAGVTGGQPASDDSRGGYRRSSSADEGLTAAGFDSYFGGDFRLAPSNQSTKEFEKIFTKVLDEGLRQGPNPKIEYKIGSIDSTDSQEVGISAITVTGFTNVGGKGTGLTFVYLLDGSMDAYPTREITDAPMVQGRRPEIQLTAGDYADEALESAVIKKLTDQYGQVEFSVVGNATIPRLIRADKEDQLQYVWRMIHNAISAIASHLSQYFNEGPRPLTVRDVTNHANLSILMDLNEKPSFDATGLPIRNDITMTMRATVRSDAQGRPDRPYDIVKLSSFINLVFTMPQANTNYNQRPDTRRFTPVMTITELTSTRSMLTPETQVLALAMAPLLDNQDQYLAVFQASATARRPGRDFGAVGIEVDLSGTDSGQPVGPEDMTKLSTAQFFEMARLSLFPDLHVALAINESGAQTWLNSMFLAAANNTSGPEYAAIVQAANNLTGGVFGDMWQGGAICRTTGTRYPVGYYLDDDNEIRDLQDIDYLWVLNRCGQKNLDNVVEFGETFIGEGSADFQLVQRMQIISKFVRSATVIGYGQYVEVDPDFLVTLIAACAKAGLPLRATNNLIDLQGARGRASYAGGGGLNKAAISATVNAGGPQRRTNQGYGGTIGLNNGWRHNR